jgi:Poxvirus A22 protein
MRICSWDVGIYNLSYCILEQDDETKAIKILKWDIVNLVDNENQKKNRPLLFQNIPLKLNQIPELLEVDYVYIENQPVLKNPQMKSIQIILYSYFLFYGITDGILIQTTGEDGSVEERHHKVKGVDFCSASNKLKVYDGPVIALEDLKKKPAKETKPKKEKKGTKGKKGEEKEKGEEDAAVDYMELLDSLDSEDEEYEEKFAEIMAAKTAVASATASAGAGPDVPKTVIDATTQKGGSSLAYADKKKLAIAHATYFLKDQDPGYLEFFQSHKKRDDLADSFLQGVYVLKKVLSVPVKEPKTRQSRKKKE